MNENNITVRDVREIKKLAAKTPLTRNKKMQITKHLKQQRKDQHYIDAFYQEAKKYKYEIIMTAIQANQLLYKAKKLEKL